MIIAYKARTNRFLSALFSVFFVRALLRYRAASNSAISPGNVLYMSLRNHGSIIVLYAEHLCRYL